MPYLVSADHIAPQGGGFEPQRKNNFTIILPYAGNIIRQALDSCPLPVDESEVITIPFGNEKRKVAGPTTFNDIAVAIKDFVDSPVIQQIMAWRNKVRTLGTGASGGQIHYASEYKNTGTIVMFGPDGKGNPIKKWQIEGVWPSRVDPGGGSMGDAGNNIVTVTLQIDKAYLVS